MSFEPRLFCDDDAPPGLPADAAGLEPVLVPASRQLAADEGVFELPVELAALGSQLSDDADHLTRLYPVGRTEFQLPSISAKATGGARRMIRWAAAAAVLLIGMLSWPMIAERSGDGTQPTDDVRPVDVSLASPAAKSNAAAVESKSSLGGEGFPATVFRGLTGAEQEAVLDLIQGDPHGQSHLSI